MKFNRHSSKINGHNFGYPLTKSLSAALNKTDKEINDLKRQTDENFNRQVQQLHI